jgi:hypothetical protein
MSVDIESLTMPDLLTLLSYEGKVPPGPEFDDIRMSPQEWAALFPAAAAHDATPAPEGGETDAGVPDTTAPAD